MNALDIDKIRKKIVKEGYKPQHNGSSVYKKGIFHSSVNPNSVLSAKVINITINFEPDRKHEYGGGLNITHWCVRILIEDGIYTHMFEIYTYHSNIVDDILLRVKQYIAFEEFLKK